MFKSTFFIFILFIATACKRNETKSTEISDTTLTRIAPDVKPPLRKVELNFPNFISLLSNNENVSDYQAEPYYFNFMSKNYGGPVRLKIISSNNNFFVFLTHWSEMEVAVDQIWVYRIDGQSLSEFGINNFISDRIAYTYEYTDIKVNEIRQQPLTLEVFCEGKVIDSVTGDQNEFPETLVRGTFKHWQELTIDSLGNYTLVETRKEEN